MKSLQERIQAGEFNGNSDRLRFRTALETDEGMVGHPKAQRLWDLAWCYGHAEGWSEVRFWYLELVTLIEGPSLGWKTSTGN